MWRLVVYSWTCVTWGLNYRFENPSHAKDWKVWKGVYFLNLNTRHIQIWHPIVLHPSHRQKMEKISTRWRCIILTTCFRRTGLAGLCVRIQKFPNRRSQYQSLVQQSILLWCYPLKLSCRKWESLVRIKRSFNGYCCRGLTKWLYGLTWLLQSICAVDWLIYVAVSVAGPDRYLCTWVAIMSWTTYFVIVLCIFKNSWWSTWECCTLVSGFNALKTKFT